MGVRMEKGENRDKAIKASNDAILLILRQSFEHWRHIENMRQGFTTIWAAIVAGVLAFISQAPNALANVASIPVIVFLALLTSLGLFVSIRLGKNIAPCEFNIKDILKQEGLEKYDPTVGWGKGITAHFRLRTLYNLFYFFALIFLCVLMALILLAAQLPN
jgi:hypothetical protein